MSLSNILLVTFLVVWNLTALAFFLVKLQIWGILWLAIEGLVAVAEIVSKVRTGRTISQKFGDWAEKNKTKAILILGGVLLSMVLLVAHLVT